jgi:hypothetical protein
MKKKRKRRITCIGPQDRHILLFPSCARQACSTHRARADPPVTDTAGPFARHPCPMSYLLSLIRGPALPIHLFLDERSAPQSSDHRRGFRGVVAGAPGLTF